LIAVPLGAQDPIGHPSKVKGNRRLILTFPRNAAGPIGRGDTLTMTEIAGGWAVNGTPMDSILGFPAREACKTWYTVKSKKRNDTVVIMRCAQNREYFFKLPLDDSLAARAFRAAVTDSANLAAVYLELEQKLVVSVFKGPLSSVPMERRVPLLRTARASDASPFFRAESFQSKTFFGIDLGAYPSVYNTAKLSQNQRLSSALRQSLLNYVKTFKSALGENSGVDGICLTVAIGHQNFVTAYSKIEFDLLRLYLPSALINRFADAEITDQELIDGAVVMLNGNRSKVVMADGG
jgi:hypothetical protein